MVKLFMLVVTKQVESRPIMSKLKLPLEYSDTGRVQIFVVTISARNDQYLSG